MKITQRFVRTWLKNRCLLLSEINTQANLFDRSAEGTGECLEFLLRNNLFHESYYPTRFASRVGYGIDLDLAAFMTKLAE